MGEIPKKDPATKPVEKIAPSGISALFSSPNSFPFFLCAAALVLVGGGIFYAANRQDPVRLSDVTRSPLGFDVDTLGDDEPGAASSLLALTQPLVAYGTSSPTSSSSHMTSPIPAPAPAPVKMPSRKAPRMAPADTPPQPFEDPELHDDDFNGGSNTFAAKPEVQQRVELLEQEIQQLRNVLVQRERMIAQLTRELADTRVRPPLVAMEASPRLEPMATKAPRTHMVQRGETLSGISERYYGTRTAWVKLYRANAEKLPDKNRLPVGVVLNIPE